MYCEAPVELNVWGNNRNNVNKNSWISDHLPSITALSSYISKSIRDDLSSETVANDS